MRTANIPCWITTHKKMKCRLAMRISSQLETRWSKKQQKWKPGLSSVCQASRAVGRPRKRWEDEINKFLKPEESEKTNVNDLKNNDTWMRVAKDQTRWKEMEKDTSETSQKGAEVYRDGHHCHFRRCCLRHDTSVRQMKRGKTFDEYMFYLSSVMLIIMGMIS